jgi:hypothetical protein
MIGPSQNCVGFVHRILWWIYPPHILDTSLREHQLLTNQIALGISILIWLLLSQPSG